MKLFKRLSIYSLVSTCLLLTLPSISFAAQETSEASVFVRSGYLFFEDMANNANITFEETTITGREQVLLEKKTNKANIVVKDFRSELRGFYHILVKDITPSSEKFSFISNNLKLTLPQTSLIDPSRERYINVTENDQEFFTGKADSSATERVIPINPKLTIPSSLTESGNYKATLEWSFIIAEI